LFLGNKLKGVTMAKLNVKPQWTEQTHEGAPAARTNAEQQLRRSVMACMLWENTFYEEGVSIADRISKTIPHVKQGVVSDIAIEAREKMKLRHVPLLLARELAAYKYPVASLLERIIQRPDELTEFLALYWKDKRQPLSAQVKKGLARAFTKFNAYQLAKYNRDGAVKLRDVLFLSHAKPKNQEQADTWKKLVDNTLEAPDTWEVNLSAGKDKKGVWERLLAENSLGALALLRNLRNMKESSVDDKLIFDALERMKVERVLPFRFIAAARHAPQWEDRLEPVMFKCLEGHEKMSGKTVLLVDVSGSMEGALSRKSDMTCMDAACALAMLVREICENVSILTFSDKVVQIPPRRGFALRDAIIRSQDHSGTYLGKTIDLINQKESYDRLIVFTDEQSHDRVNTPNGLGYMVNVVSYQKGVGYGKWLHIDGFSEAIIDYIIQTENN
jgi:60 kDa SS-A/Ro ribonucleoprotein